MKHTRVALSCLVGAALFISTASSTASASDWWFEARSKPFSLPLANVLSTHAGTIGVGLSERAVLSLGLGVATASGTVTEHNQLWKSNSVNPDGPNIRDKITVNNYEMSVSIYNPSVGIKLFLREPIDGVAPYVTAAASYSFGNVEFKDKNGTQPFELNSGSGFGILLAFGAQHFFKSGFGLGMEFGFERLAVTTDTTDYYTQHDCSGSGECVEISRELDDRVELEGALGGTYVALTAAFKL